MAWPHAEHILWVKDIAKVKQSGVIFVTEAHSVGRCGKQELMAVSCYRMGNAEQSGLRMCEAPKTGHGIVHLCSTVDGNSDSVINQMGSSPPQLTYSLWDLGPGMAEPEFPHL